MIKKLRRVNKPKVRDDFKMSPSDQVPINEF